MFPYWLLFSLFAAGASLYRPDENRRVTGGPYFLAMGVAVALMIGLRWEVGGDWINYIDIFKDITANGISGARAQDPGYGVLNWVVGQMGIGVWLVNLVCAILFSWGLVRFARRQPNPWLIILVSIPYLVIVVAMGYTRQAVAIGFILAGLANFDRKPIWHFGIYLLLAAAFHKSAVVIAPLVALTATRNRLVTGLVIMASAALVYYLFVQASVDRLMINYVTAEYGSGGAAFRVPMNIPPALLFLLFQRRFAVNDQERKLWRNFSLAALLALAGLVLTDSAAAVDRLALYLIPLQMFVLGRLPTAFADKGRSNVQLVLFVVLYSATIQFVWLNWADNSWAWLPYKFIPLTADN
ncbi:MAG TPA: EpsG family protein [Allosphingosinicella sp.]